MTADHAYTDNGTYPVTLTVTDDDGATNSTTALKTVLNRPPVANFTWEPEVPRVNEVVTFNATASYDPDGTIVLYTWDFGDLNVTSTTNPVITHIYTMIGEYTVTLTVTDDDEATDSTSAPVTVSGRDVAALNIVVVYPLGYTWAYPGWKINITVTVRNEGPVAETFWVALYYNLTASEWNLIGNETVTDLPSLTNKTLTFVWNTTGMPASIVNGNYTIYTFNATASTVPYEVDTGDNVLVGGAVWLKLLGDVNGDGEVNILDVKLVSLAYSLIIIEPSADLDCNGVVNILDLKLMKLAYAKIIVSL